MRKVLKNRDATDKELIDILGTQLALEKIKSKQKDDMFNQLGQEITKLKIEIIQMKGGA